MSNPKGSDGSGRQDGDARLAARWMDRHWAAMVEAARRYAGGCPMAAEDIAQEALWAAYQRRDRLADPAGERAWLLASVGNEGRAAVERRRRRGERLPEEYLEAAADPNTPDGRRRQVLEVLPRLPKTQRRVVRLLLDGWSREQVASRLRLKMEAYWFHKYGAIQRIRYLLDDDARRRLRSTGRRNHE